MTEWLTVAAAAEELGVSTRFVLDELRRKNLRGSKLKGRAGWRISPADLTVYVESHMNVTKVRGR